MRGQLQEKVKTHTERERVITCSYLICHTYICWLILTVGVSHTHNVHVLKSEMHLSSRNDIEMESLSNKLDDKPVVSSDTLGVCVYG